MKALNWFPHSTTIDDALDSINYFDPSKLYLCMKVFNLNECGKLFDELNVDSV